MLNFGNGEVLFDGSSKAFQLKYTGTITITESPDNLFLTANKTKIIRQKQCIDSLVKI